ncbi:MAG TPA: HigA family addiction module antitoxin [Rhizomicrobium sp.]|jgi:addiction module HigA family antidote|nr:HigA family addiction module antitoxin [Rhizomicrobium sp.]
MNKRWPGIRPVHPGEMLREIVFPALGTSKTEIARLLGVSRQTLYDVLNEKQPITANLALRIGKLIGDDPENLLRMQQSYDLEIAQRALAKTLKGIPTLQAAE